MIPKIIHYCWFGRKEKPSVCKEYMASWKKHLPDYQFKEWNESNFDVNFCSYSREAYSIGNMAFVADVCRIYALHTEGGIYLDMDTEMLTPFGSLLKEKNGFAGRENDDVIGMGVIGSEKGSAWTKYFLEYYKRTHFINAWGHPVRRPNSKRFTLEILPSLPEADRPRILPLGYIVDIDHATGRYDSTSHTIAVNHNMASWKTKKTLGTRLETLARGFLIRHLHIYKSK